jgi:hypothetical protein
MTFPVHVYRCPGQYTMTDGLSWDCKTANDQDEFDAALQSGWFATLADAGLSAGDRAYVARKIAPWRKKRIKAKKTTAPATAQAKTVQPVDDNAPATREELEQKAVELGIKFDGRTTDKRLGEKISAALKGET